MRVRRAPALVKRIQHWQATDLVTVGGYAQASWVGNGSVAADYTVICPGWAVTQDTTIRQIAVNVLARDGAAWKLKLFRYNSGITKFDFVSETTFTPAATGAQVINLDTPLAAQPGDVLGIYCPASNQIKSDNTTVRSQKFKYAAGDITTSTLFTPASYSELDLEARGYKPYLAISGDSIPEGSGNGSATTHWYALYDTLPATVKSLPGGTPTSEVANQLRALIGDGTMLQYQDCAKGSTQYSWVAATGIVAAVAAKPHTVIVLAGTNDINSAIDWSVVSGNLDTIKAACSAANVRRLMICEILPRTNFDDTKAATVRTWNASIATWCAANQAILIVAHDEMGQLRVSTGYNDDLLTAYNLDDIHLKPAGVNALAAIWARYL